MFWSATTSWRIWIEDEWGDHSRGFLVSINDHYNTRQSDMYRTLWTPIAGQYFVIYKNTHVTKL